MIAWWWSWLLTLVGVAGFLLAGQRVWWAWYVNIVNQALWLGYSLVTGQLGFLAGTAVYSVVFIRNAVKWTREHRDQSLPEQGRRLASERENLIARGFDPNDLERPL